MRLSVKIIVLVGVVTAATLIGLRFHHRTPVWQASGVVAKQQSQPVATALPAARPIVAPKPTTIKASVSPVAMPEWLRLVLTPPMGVRYADRVRALKARTGKLSHDDIQALYSYLLAPANTDADSRVGENWLRNVILDLLVRQPDPPAGLPAMLVSIFQDTNQDIVMRDYAIQHIDPAYGRSSPDEQAQLNQTLWEATAETDSSIAGTALLALDNLAQNNVDYNKIAQTALKLAEDDQCGDLARITAVQLCGQMDVEQAGPLVVSLAQNAPSIPLQIAAIAALGNLGDRSAETFLQNIIAGDQDRLKPAAQTALKQLQQRLGT